MAKGTKASLKRVNKALGIIKKNATPFRKAIREVISKK